MGYRNLSVCVWVCLCVCNVSLSFISSFQFLHYVPLSYFKLMPLTSSRALYRSSEVESFICYKY